jgi:hypothetical protein
MAATLGGHPPSRDAAAALELLFQRVVIAPGDDPTAFPVAIAGARLIEIDRSGAVLAHVGSGVKRQPSPRAYQNIDGRRLEVPVRFVITPGGDLRLIVGSYDRTRPLVIEPWPGNEQ